MTDSLKGRLIVATPILGDRNFHRTVVLMLEHTEEGAVGVVVNRPSATTLADSLPGWDRFSAHPSVVFVGGPVEESAVICLALAAEDVDDDLCSRLLGDLGTFDLTRDPDEVGGAIEQLRVFAGYAGWSAAQLEDEIDAGAWFVLDAEPEDALSESPEELWPAVLRRQRGRARIFANYPPSLSVN
jgi:putative transcriptional regulator